MNSNHPDYLYHQLYESASSRKKKTLTLIHEICKEQHDKNEKDFSIVTIAALLAKKGGLSEQALRNKNAEPYRLLIQKWAEYSNTTTKKPKTKKTSTVNDEILSSIQDPTTKALVGMILAENKKLKNENHLLKSQTCFTIDMRSQNNSATQNTVVITSALKELSDTEKDALKHAVSESFFKSRGWTVEKNGRVKEKGTPVYNIGYMNAMEKILNEIKEAVPNSV